MNMRIVSASYSHGAGWVVVAQSEDGRLWVSRDGASWEVIPLPRAPDEDM